MRHLESESSDIPSDEDGIIQEEEIPIEDDAEQEQEIEQEQDFDIDEMEQDPNAPDKQQSEESD
jgi:hypothetical protein